MKDSIGIDISKDQLDVHRPRTGASARFGNTPAGFRALQRWIGDTPPDLLVYEATGAYHAALERRFAGTLPLVKVNPLQARRFAQARGTRAKTDAVDARILAVMGSALDLVPDRPAGENQHALKQLQIARMALIKERTRLLNRSKTQTLPILKRQSKARLAQIKCQLSETRQSGQWRGKAFIQGGRKFLRDTLYMPALVAARYNPDLRQKYQALIKAGKPAKVALTVLMRKLIELANALIQQDRNWVPKTT